MNTLVETFAQANYSCTINGRPGTSEECAQVGGVLMAVFIPLIIIGVLFFIWWITTLIHVLTHEDVPNRVLWIVLHFVGLGLLVAPVYQFAVKRPYKRSHSGSPPPPQAPVSS